MTDWTQSESPADEVFDRLVRRPYPDFPFPIISPRAPYGEQFAFIGRISSASLHAATSGLSVRLPARKFDGAGVEIIPVRKLKKMRGFLRGIDTSMPRDKDRV
jgi:hypothetical protein